MKVVRYEINFSGEGSGERLRLPMRPPMLPDIDNPYVVGFDLDRDNIVKQLLDTNIKRRAVISIVGPGGLGKTTLARKVYNSNDVKRQFDVRIWVAISQEFNLKDIFKKIIEHVEPLSQSDQEGEEEYLLTKLYKTLNGEKYTREYLCPKSHEPLSDEEDPQAREKPKPKKYLLVLDDIWTKDLWTRIGGAVLPDAEIGSRVIITTRFLNIAEGAEPYELPYLTKKLSLELLFKKALPNRDLSKGYPDDVYEVGIQFVKKCGGLPLALVVLGGLLSKRPVNYAAWNKMLQTMNWGTDGRECTEIIATSYNDLPFVLKSCFMYLAVFPEDHEIDAQRLYRLWVAERLIPVEEFRTLEDTAESFLEDLVQRSLVQVSQRSHASLSITSCRIHDLLREVAIQKAKEDNFLTICSNPDNWKSGGTARRLAVHYLGCDQLMEHANPNLRSLLYSAGPMPNCSGQRMLKVVSDMGHGRRKYYYKCFDGLTQLRYCELSGGWDSNIYFESFIGSLKFVETLDLSLEGPVDLPDDIWNVKILRHVKLRWYSKGPSSSADLRNLQTLMGVRSEESWNAQLPKLPNVRDLNIEVQKSSWDAIAGLLGTMKHLTCLSLLGFHVPQKIVNMQRFPFYEQLQSLFLQEQSPLLNIPNKLSPEVGMFPIHVMELTLVVLQFQDDPLPVLEKLHCLRVLRLIQERTNQKMRCSAGGFKQLHQMEFERLSKLEEWEIQAGAMLILKLLKVEDCQNLRVPLGLRYLSNLKELKVPCCPILEKHADEIRYMCKDVPFISFL